jgi:hypothetical protein
MDIKQGWMWASAVLVVCAAGCGKAGDSAAPAETAAEPAAAAAPAVPGEMKEGEFCRILVPAGWEFADFGKKTVQTYNRSGTFMVQVQMDGFNQTEGNVESSLESMRARQNGTPLEKVDLKGMSFWTTTFETGGRSQTFYNTLKDGRTLSIALSGPDHQNDPTIRAVFDSIEIK